MENFYPWIIAICVIVLVVCVGSLLLKIGSFARQRYRRAIWERAAYVARERPDLVAKVAAQHELAPGKELEVSAPRRPKYSGSMQGLSREDLERYAHSLEEKVRVLYHHWSEVDVLAEKRRVELAQAIKLKRRYWGRIKRVLEAEANGEDMSAALHPSLPKETS